MTPILPAPKSSLRQPGHRRVMITGGAGFIGTNLAHRLLSQGHHVLVYDNLSRPGVERNLNWLRSHHRDRLAVEIADVRDRGTLRRAVAQATEVFHLAAQVAVTTSLDDPGHDFEINARGTLNLLEELRAARRRIPLLFTSTNKVYGALADVPLKQEHGRYHPSDLWTAQHGISEQRPLDFCSPYGCSKGAADQYVLDYAHSFNLPTIVFRMSCIYGPHQMGTEDQGWVAHFVKQAIAEQTITLYGDGLQVRDILFVDDLVEAMLLAQVRLEQVQGQAFNIGGGPRNALSLLELLGLIRELIGHEAPVDFGTWRAGDQRYFVADTRKFRRATGWAPKVTPRMGVRQLEEFLRGQLEASARQEPLADAAPTNRLKATELRSAGVPK